MDIVKTAPTYVVYKMGKLLDQSVAALDPLGFDKYFTSGNFSDAATASTSEKIREFEDSVTSNIQPDAIRRLDEVAAMAAARDLNMIASACTRHGIPMRKMPQLEEFLLMLAEKTREVPTDTVFGYGVRNPTDERQRSFTKTPEETLFIESFSFGMNGLNVALAGLESAQTLTLTHPKFSLMVQGALDHLSSMQDAILAVRKNISPEFFTQKLRPFFEPKILAGDTYFAAGGAQMPVTMIDLLLWGIEVKDRTYVSYRNENTRYLPRSYRSKIELIMQQPSILHNVQLQTEKGYTTMERATISAGLVSLRKLADQMILFRAPHLAIAKANMRIRSEGSVGSGGYEVAILQYLIKKTKDFKKAIEVLEEKVAKSPP